MIGMHGRKTANYAAINSDLLIAIGCRFSDRITGRVDTFAEHAKIIHIDIDPSEIGKNVKVELPIVGDAKLILTDLMAEMMKLSRTTRSSEWERRIKELRELCECDMAENKDHITPKRLLYEIQKILKEDDIVCTGVGQHQMFAAHFLKRTKPRTFISSGGLGTMGFGFPAGIGAKIAKPDKNVFVIDGDGSFLMVCQELATCKEENIKVMPIIFNNSYLGMVRQWLELFYEKRYSHVYLGKTPNFTKLAEAFSLSGITVTKNSEIGPSIQQALKNDETTLIDVHIEQESNILPMLPPGGSLTEFFGDCMPTKGKIF
jgi:acetolactate synthase-1/2/3 large subunit